MTIVNHTSVSPAASPEKAREVDAAGGVRWGGTNRTAPECWKHCQGLALMPQPTQPGGLRDCPDLNFRLHHVALTFATHHHCPPPWAPIPAWRKRLTRSVR